MVALVQTTSSRVCGQALRALNDHRYAQWVVQCIGEASKADLSSAKAILEEARFALSWEDWETASTRSLDAVDEANRQSFRQVWKPRYEAAETAMQAALQTVVAKYPSFDFSYFYQQLRQTAEKKSLLQEKHGASGFRVKKLIEGLNSLTADLVEHGRLLQVNRVPARSDKTIPQRGRPRKQNRSRGPGRRSRYRH